MQNGIAVALPLPPSTLSSSTEIVIGEATAAAAIAIAMALDDYATVGAMTPSTKTWSGAMLGRLAQLQLDTLGELPDFGAVALAEGRRALQGHPAGIFLARLGKEQVDVVLDELIGHVLVISARVVAAELALRTN